MGQTPGFQLFWTARYRSDGSFELEFGRLTKALTGKENSDKRYRLRARIWLLSGSGVIGCTVVVAGLCGSVTGAMLFTALRASAQRFAASVVVWMLSVFLIITALLLKHGHLQTPRSINKPLGTVQAASYSSFILAVGVLVYIRGAQRVPA